MATQKFVRGARQRSARRIKRALGEQEQRYRLVVEHMKDVVFQLDLDGRCTLLNPAWTELTGFDVPRTLGTPLLDAVAPQDRALAAGQFRNLLAGLTPFCRHDVRYRSADGETRWVEAWACATKGSTGTIAGITGTLRDISERKAIEAALWEAQELLERGITQSPIGVFSIDRSGRITRANPAFARMLGLEVSALLDRPWQPLLRPGDLPRAQEFAASMLSAERDDATATFAHVHADGHTVHTRMHVSLLRDVAGTPVEFFCQVEDVTAQQNGEARLRAAEERFRVIFQESPTAMCTAHVDGRLIQVNAALQRDVGGEPLTDENELRFTDFIHPEDRTHEEALFRELVAGKRRSYACELRIVRPDRAWRWCEVMAKLLGDGAGFPSYVLRTIVDFSKRKRSEDELRRQAESDALTGILNRRAFERILNLRLSDVRVRCEEGALLVIDLDGFKRVNDTHGHETGDVLLRAIVLALSQRLRTSDVFARIGGDEFAILTSSGSEREMHAVALVVVRTVASTAKAVLADGPAISASVGVAPLLSATGGYEALFRAADSAMYRAKRSGGGRVAIGA
jgi:diguanylate cyclase (GGDEF)-like protein/PAS domain S-box-containing protein